VGFERELDHVLVTAQKNGANHDPVMRQRLAAAWIGLKLLRYNALRSLASIADGTPGPEASISKLQWATWHRALGELAVDVQGPHAMLANTKTSPRLRARANCPDSAADNPILERFSGNDDGAAYDLTDEQRLFLFSRADTIYGGSNQIQRNIIGERALGLPKG
jgi:alkylation response protein AidB-like acyl-CoA dehydrogenase